MFRLSSEWSGVRLVMQMLMELDDLEPEIFDPEDFLFCETDRVRAMPKFWTLVRFALFCLLGFNVA